MKSHWKIEEIPDIINRAVDKARAERDAEWLAAIEKMLRVTDDHSEYGLTEHERGWKNALLMLKDSMTGAESS